MWRISEDDEIEIEIFDSSLEDYRLYPELFIVPKKFCSSNC